MARGVPIDPEVRAQVIAELLTGAPVNRTARKYNLGVATVSRLQSEIAPRLEQVGIEKRASIDQLLLDSVAIHLEAMNQFVQYVFSPEYLRAKHPADLAKLYAEIREHPLSVLEAATLAQESGGQADMENDGESAH